jgi:hypothetical protein
MVRCVLVVAVAVASAGSASGGPVALRPQGDRVRTLVTEKIVPHVAIGWKVLMLKGPVEHFLRRFIGGAKQRAFVWGEYTAARDKLIDASDLSGAALARVLDDLRIEYTHRYPAWRELFLL